MTHPGDDAQDTVPDLSVPVKKDMWGDREFAREMNALWTPNFLFIDPGGTELDRQQGYLPPDEYLARFLVGAGISYMQMRDLDQSYECFDRAVSSYPGTHAAPEACYYRGVCGMRQTGDVEHIYEASKEILDRWPDHVMATKLEYTDRYDNFENVEHPEND